MYTIHKEGYSTLIIGFIVLAGINTLTAYFHIFPSWLTIVLRLLSVGVFLLLLNFFRNPPRHTPVSENSIIAPADGKVVVIEEVYEPEYFKEKRLQVSVFMSPLNVHVNRYPVSGRIKYYRYHPGKYLVAWHPKSSVLNERTSVVVEKQNGFSVLVRQIAGVLARRIVCYAKEQADARQGEELGFIKFGSRVDLFLPLGTKIKVRVNDQVTGGETVLAEIAD